MDYEKKYNEALERARKAYNAIPPESRGARKIIEDAFPELRESEDEDERIRKWLITQLQNNYKGNYWATQAIEYLEKQKEQKPVDYEAELKKCKDNPLYFYDKYVSIKQKPAEWSEEDEKMLSDLRNTLGCLMNAGAITFKTKKKFSNWLKSLRPSWKPSEEQMDRLFSIVAALRKDYCDDMADFLANLYADLKKL